MQLEELTAARPIEPNKDPATTPVVVISHRKQGYFCAQKHWGHGTHGANADARVLVTQQQLNQLKRDETGFISCLTLEEYMGQLGAQQKSANEDLRKAMRAEVESELIPKIAKLEADLAKAQARIAELEAAPKGKK
jgi:hypothetical protein